VRGGLSTGDGWRVTHVGGWFRALDSSRPGVHAAGELFDRWFEVIVGATVEDLITDEPIEDYG
jgi:hypothetical protein